MRLTLPVVGIMCCLFAASVGRSQDTSVANLRTAPAPVAARQVIDVNAIDVNAIDALLRHAVQSNPELRGAWMDVEFDDRNDPGVAQGHFTFRRRITDLRNHARQTALLQELMQRLVPRGNYSVDVSEDRVLPFSDLLESLAESVSLDYPMAGCRLEGAYYDRSSSAAPNRNAKLNLVLLGRVRPSDPQDPAIEIEKRCILLMRRNPVWISGQLTTSAANSQTTQPDVEPLQHVGLLIDPSSEKLKIVRGSFSRATSYYEAGRKAYFAGDVCRARNEFSMAAVEYPVEQIFRYWVALCDLTLGDRERAKRNLVTAKRIESASGVDYSSAGVDHSLRRVQGHLRLSLREMTRIAATNAAIDRGAN